MPATATERSGIAHFWNPAARAWPAAVVAGLSSFVIFAATASPFVETHDVAEMQALAATGGIAHAGYPTLVLLMRLVSGLSFGTLAWRVDVLSGLAGAVAVAALAYTSARLTRNAVVSVGCALAFAMSFTMWNESARIGVHALTLAIGSVTFLATMVFAHSPSRLRSLAIGFLSGLGLTCHLTSLGLTGPLLLALGLTLRNRTLRSVHVLLVLLGVGIGLSPFAYTLAVDQPAQRMNYMNDTFAPEGGPATVWRPDLQHRVSRLRWLLSGRQYLRESKYAAASIPRRTLHLVVDEAVNEFPLPSLVLATVGFMLLVVTGGFVGAAAGTWFVAVAALTVRAGTEATAAWFFLPGAWLLGLGLGLAAACSWFATRRPRLGAALAVGLALLPVVRAGIPSPPGPLGTSSTLRTVWARWPAEWSPFRFERRYDRFGRTALAALPPDAIVLSRWSPACVLRYLSYAEGLREDVEIRFAPDQDGERFLRRWRAAAGTGRPVFVIDAPSPGALAGGSAVRVLTSDWCGLWLLRPGPPAARGPAL